MSIDDVTPRPHDGAGEPVTGTPVAAASHLRVGTVVWGLVLALLGVGVAAVGAGAALDLQAALIVLLVIAGTALLVGAFVTARRAHRS